LALQPLRDHGEKTYSAPLATHSYAKETVFSTHGSEQSIFPRLAYGGAQLKDVERGYHPDIVRRSILGAGGGCIFWLAIVAGFVVGPARLRGENVKAVWYRLRRDETGVRWRPIGLTLLPLCILGGLAVAFAGGYHVLGTDKVGQDVLYEALKSVRTALVIGTLTTLLMVPFAIAFGIGAGYAGGWIDDVIQYIYTTLYSIPAVLLIAASILMMQVFIDRHPEWFQTEMKQADIRLLVLCVILGVTNWTGLCRLLRGETLKLRELEYIQAAHASGVRNARIIGRHILPNVMHIVLINVVLAFSDLVLAEAVLSYIGVGVDPSMNSYGTMINSARLEMARDPMVWWPLASAFVFMVTLVLAANLFADAVRDAFDPRVLTRHFAGKAA
jgi:peptide/nickel transport system permease protein